MRSDIFVRLPPPTALLLLCSVFEVTSAYAIRDLPRQTAAAEAKPVDPLFAFDISPYPPLPTSAPFYPGDLRRRQELNTVCGFIGGDPGLPATCSAGSHCVLEAAHGVVGCCPDGQDPCTTGIFTACVDGNSPAKGGAADPFAFTCSGDDVCYKNKFEGGYSQFGCGSASSLAATVFASASGIKTTIDPPSLSISFTGTTSATSRSRSSTRSRTRSNSSSHSSSSHSSTPTTEPTTAPTAESTAAPPTTGTTSRSSDNTGAIVGGTISGVAVLIAAVAAGMYLWRRRQRTNRREGPGPGPKNMTTQYISPSMAGGGGGGAVGAGGNAQFQPLHQSYEAWESGLQPGAAVVYPPQPVPPPHAGAYPVAGAQPMGGRGVDGEPVHGDLVPLTREIDDFSRGFHDALGRIDEEDYTSTAGTEVTVGSGHLTGAGAAGGDSRPTTGDGRPLWQQNRRMSRNMMWM